MYHIPKVCIFHGRSAGTFRFYVKCIPTEIEAPELLTFFSLHTLETFRFWLVVMENGVNGTLALAEALLFDCEPQQQLMLMIVIVVYYSMSCANVKKAAT